MSRGAHKEETTIIQEGDLCFTFDPSCKAAKYDEWAFYRRQFCKTATGIKAVDIVCIDSNRLWLIEVKDYRAHRRTKLTDIADECVQKVVHSLAGIFAAGVNAFVEEEKVLANAAKHSNSIGVVLHLEQPQKPSKLFPHVVDISNLETKLKQKLKSIDPHPRVINKSRVRQDMNWRVEG